MTTRDEEIRGPTAEELHRRALEGWAAMTDHERARWIRLGVGLGFAGRLELVAEERRVAERAWHVPAELAR